MAKFFVGSNMPGYMPDSDPHTCATLKEAKESLASELRMRRDDFETEEFDANFNEAIKEVLTHRQGDYCSRNIGGYVYWIAKG